MKKLFLILFAFAAIGINAQETPASTTVGTNTGTGELEAIVTQLNANDVTLRTGITSNTTLAATNQGLNRLMSDTVVLFWFSVGEGLATDTTKLSTSAEYAANPPYLGGSDTAYITQLICTMQTGVKAEGVDTLDIQMAWDVNLSDATPTELNASALPILSITTGTEDTSFAESVIPPGSHVWFTTPAVVTGRKPVQLVCIASGYYTD